jgi:hypothetical protein
MLASVKAVEASLNYTYLIASGAVCDCRRLRSSATGEQKTIAWGRQLSIAL